MQDILNTRNRQDPELSSDTDSDGVSSKILSSPDRSPIPERQEEILLPNFRFVSIEPTKLVDTGKPGRSITMNNPFFSMAAPVATGVTFAGLPKDGPATEYLKHCQMMAAMSNVPKEYADTFTRHVFIQGLRGKAEMWYQDLDFEDRVWAKMSDQFLKKFEKPDPLFEMALQKEVVGFAREKGETLKAFVQRAERLASKVKSELRQMLFTNFISNLADGEVDLRLQERISDRLYASTKWANGMASKDLTMSDLKVLMYDCRTSASENIPKLSEEAITPASPFHQWMEDQAKRDKGKDDQMSEL
ncbi:hypothetical protein E4U17_000976, partial [Claviceps sp. LM77 group G4]